MSVCVSPIVARQRLGKNVTTTNTYATIEKLLDESFLIPSVQYEAKVGDQFFPELLFLQNKESRLKVCITLPTVSYERETGPLNRVQK
jgi:hypothetical protein